METDRESGEHGTKCSTTSIYLLSNCTYSIRINQKRIQGIKNKIITSKYWLEFNEKFNLDSPTQTKKRGDKKKEKGQINVERVRLKGSHNLVSLSNSIPLLSLSLSLSQLSSLAQIRTLPLDPSLLPSFAAPSHRQATPTRNKSIHVSATCSYIRLGP